jgi:hypothetical protein
MPEEKPFAILVPPSRCELLPVRSLSAFKKIADREFADSLTLAASTYCVGATGCRRSEILHLDQIAVDATRPLSIGRVVE